MECLKNARDHARLNPSDYATAKRAFVIPANACQPAQITLRNLAAVGVGGTWYVSFGGGIPSAKDCDIVLQGGDEFADVPPVIGDVNAINDDPNNALTGALQIYAGWRI